jgi:farnesyl diphosphate synthase
VGLLARAAGHAGMAGGQAVDLASVGQCLTEADLRDMHRRKTGALLQCSVLMGAACGPAAPATTAALEDYGAALGLAFQVVDDILDCTQASETLGKTAGKDLDAQQAHLRVRARPDRRKAACPGACASRPRRLARSGLGESAGLLATLADRVVERES